MKANIKLISNSGFRWYNSENIFVKGYIFDENNKFIEGNELLKFFSEKLLNIGKLSKDLENIDGIFSLVIQIENEILMYTDKTRFFTLFYQFNNNTISISDQAETLNNNKSEVNKYSLEEFRYSGFVAGNRTLINNIFQLQASELIHISNTELKSKILFNFRIQNNEIIHFLNPMFEMENKLDSAFHKLAHSLQNKTPILPLSGGFDSRLIACKLKEAGFENTICFTYGRKNKEVEISKKVAEELQFKWYFIDYEELIRKRNLLRENKFIQYYQYSSNYSSMFYLQEYMAVEYLKNNLLIPENSVFIPGHSGDLLGGSQFLKVFNNNIQPKNVAETIVQTKYFLFPNSKKLKNKFQKNIEEQLGSINEFNGHSLIEDWDIKEKIAKFIFNSSKVFPFFGYEIRFPFWENELVEFFRVLPTVHRNGKVLYDQCLTQIYFSKYSVNFNEEINVGKFKIKFQSIKDFIKSFIPDKYKKRIIRKHDWMCYHEMSLPFLNELPKEIRKILPWKNYNSILINWYLFKTFRC